MIVGVGIDLLEIDRIKKLLGQTHGERFVARVLTPEERELAAERRGARLAEFVAGRFAAKEAVVKAIGCGLGRAVGFQDIRILPDASGKPECSLTPEAWERLGRRQPLQIHLSISHSSTMAGAYAVAEVRKGAE
jgi:holo-[acyl-carrier protein] synthase